jgi:hypothetical protein
MRTSGNRGSDLQDVDGSIPDVGRISQVVEHTMLMIHTDFSPFSAEAVARLKGEPGGNKRVE